MTANNDAHVATLQKIRAEVRKSCELWARQNDDTRVAERRREEAALDAAIRALSADRGEAVLSPNSNVWTSLDIILASAQSIKADKPLVAADIIGHLQQIVDALEPLTKATSPSPAESAEGVLGYIGANVAAHLREGGHAATTITGHRAMLDDVAIYERAAAPSQVSDAFSLLVAVAKAAHEAMDNCDELADRRAMLAASGASALCHALDAMDALPEIPGEYLYPGWARAQHFAIQPQPGRVEGMVLVPVGKLRAWRDLIGAAPDGVKAEIKDLLAAAPTAGGSES